jgi:protein gp37
LRAMGQPRYRDGFRVTLQDDLLDLPLRWRTPRRIFVNSMSDLFHQAVPEAFIQRVFATMRQADWHCFQILTKRAECLAALAPHLPWRPHIWMGVSVESRHYVSRIDALRQTGAHVKFLSLEPLLGALPNLDLRGIDWVIVGGESGPDARSMNPAWVLDLRDQCQQAQVPFFFKQWGGVHKKRTGRVLEGRTWNEMPALPRPVCVGQPALMDREDRGDA